MRKLEQTIFILFCAILLSACGSVDLGGLGVDTGEVENFVDDVQEDLGIGDTRTPTPEGAATATATRTPQPTLIPTFTPAPDGPILTGAGPSTSGSGSSSSQPPLQVVEVTLSGDTYTVVDGDTLNELAEQFGVTPDELYSANLDLVTDRDLIEVGWVLQIPE
ncbi:MAG: LysM peptidoglycan-binding domain-containing protein [Anaerolineae bacterium]